MLARCPVCGAKHASCGGPTRVVAIDLPTEGAKPMAGKTERVQLKDGSVLKLNAQERKVYEEQGLVGEPARAGRVPGPEDPEGAFAYLSGGGAVVGSAAKGRKQAANKAEPASANKGTGGDTTEE